MMLGALLLGLGGVGCETVEPAFDAAPETGGDGLSEVRWSVEPSSLDFGDVPLGMIASGAVTLTNTGGSSFTLADLEPGTEAAVFEYREGKLLLPGESTTIGATWIPTATAHLRATMELTLSGAEGLVGVPIDLEGLGVAPEASLDWEDRPFGQVGTGCPASRTVIVANDGKLDLHVESLDLVATSEFSVEYSGVAKLAPPWTLQPGESRTVDINFLPGDIGDALATLTLASDDPLQPELALELSVTVVQGPEVRDIWVVPALADVESVTGLFAVNEVVNTTYRDRFAHSLPTFFETLQGAGVPYRVAFVHSTIGVVDGVIPYIDETLSPADATTLALAMVAGASGDNDALLETLNLAIPANLDWLSADGVSWAESELNLVGLDDDQEQSSGNATFYLLQYESYKTDPTDVTVHGIGGDVPTGCGSAYPFTKFADAATATGGLFLSICAEDWTRHMHSLALAFLGEGSDGFALSAVPPDSGVGLEVQVDGVPVTTGWEYDVPSNTVYLAAESRPAPGAELRIYYTIEESCP